MNAERLMLLDRLPLLSKGTHLSLADGACFMEAVSYIAGEPWSDRPNCVCPVIGMFLRSWNDNLLDGERDALLRPLIPLVIGTWSTRDVGRRRAFLAADWVARQYTPAWLRVTKLGAHAEALAALPEATGMARRPSLMPALDADAVYDAVGGTAKAAARAVLVAWEDADIAGITSLAAAGDVAWGAADTAFDAVIAAGDPIESTRLALQQSALLFVHQMAALTAEAAA